MTDSGDELGERRYQCLTCDSDDVVAFERKNGTVHIYCKEDGCGWIHRDVPVGVFR